SRGRHTGFGQCSRFLLYFCLRFFLFFLALRLFLRFGLLLPRRFLFLLLPNGEREDQIADRDFLAFAHMNSFYSSGLRRWDRGDGFLVLEFDDVLTFLLLV